MTKSNTQLQIEFTRVDKTKNDLRYKKNMLKDILSDDPEYQKALEQREAVNMKIKQILTGIGEANPKLLEEIDTLKMHLKNDKEMMSDLALNQLMDGETVSVSDEDGNVYDPIWSVRFVKTKSEN